MKVIPFTIPVAMENAVIVQEDRLSCFYPHLHRHNETQITWIQKGEGTLIAGNYMQPFRDNEIYIIGANQPHVFKSDARYFDKRRKQSVQSLTLFFNPAGFFKPLLELPEMKAIRKFTGMTTYGLRLKGSSKENIRKEMLAVSQSKHALRLAAFLQLLHTMSGIKDWERLSSGVIDQSLSDKEGLRINEVYQFTLANFRTPVTLSQVAGVAYMTPAAFCRYFKKHTRKTYVAFLNEIRIAEACKMIMAGRQRNFSAIAYETGFTNAIHFNRVFKKVTGVTPGRFQKIYRTD